MSRKPGQNRMHRVDIQVCILIACIVTFTCASVYAVCYTITYNDMISSLNDRVNSIYDYLENNLDKSTFTEIRTREDRAKTSYQAMKELLKNTKSATGVRYLYTATQTEDGSFIYLIDGLDSNAEDFRYPGDPIEPEIWGEMERAMAGETVLPGMIKDTDWGKVFITYFPIHDGDSVVGVLGMEFEAEHQYNAYRMLLYLIPALVVLACLLSAAIAVILFRRISNPTYQDMANTDQLTQLKNRNAFETDTRNMMASRKHMKLGILVADLNNLKRVNDEQGHDSGDRYIQDAARALRQSAGPGDIMYRVGGDEFVILSGKARQEDLEAYVRRIHATFEAVRGDELKGTSLSLGYTVFDKERERIWDAYIRADREMYLQKKKFHDSEKEL